MERIIASTTIEELAAIVSGELVRATDVGEKRTAAGQSLDQAVVVASRQKVSLAKLGAWAKREGASEKLVKFKQRLAVARRHPQ